MEFQIPKFQTRKQAEKENPMKIPISLLRCGHTLLW